MRPREKPVVQSTERKASRSVKRPREKPVVRSSGRERSQSFSQAGEREASRSVKRPREKPVVQSSSQAPVRVGGSCLSPAPLPECVGVSRRPPASPAQGSAGSAPRWRSTEELRTGRSSRQQFREPVVAGKKNTPKQEETGVNEQLSQTEMR